MFKPKYTISDKIATQLSGIAEIKSLVAKSLLLPDREIFLRRAAIIKMAHTSTSIEGNQLHEYQVAQVAEGKQINADKRTDWQRKRKRELLDRDRFISSIFFQTKKRR